MFTRRAASAFVGANFSRRTFATAAPRVSAPFASAAKFGTAFAFGTAAVTATAFCWGAEKPVSPPWNFASVKKDLEALFEDDLALAPSVVRLAWHEAGTWDASKKDGSPNSASMRFAPECTYGANAGLDKPRKVLEGIKAKYPELSYADLWVLAANVAIESMGGPEITFRWGRKDATSGKQCPADGRLPDAAQGQGHIRDVFYRMGFNDQEIVALVGAHTIGECHAENSGFVGPWSHDKLGFDNSYFNHLLDEEWVLNTDAQLVQFKDKATSKLMMLPGDVALIVDPKFKAWVKKYAADSDLWQRDFALAFQKLTEQGTSGLKLAA